MPKQSMGFYDFDEDAQLVEAAQTLNPATYLVALLGGDAGLRCGEIIALEWADVDLRKRLLCIPTCRMARSRHCAQGLIGATTNSAGLGSSPGWGRPARRSMF